MKYEHQLITPEGVAEGDLNGEDVYEIHLVTGEVIYADKHLTEPQLRLDHPYLATMISVFACTDGGTDEGEYGREGYGISQIFVNIQHITKVIPLEVPG